MKTTSSTLIELPLAGVESEHCALIVDKGLSKVVGVTSHKVELNNQKAIITAKDAETIPQAIQAIRNLGYDVEIVKQTFPVTGMTCASCAISTESMIKAQAGVVDAIVNYASQTVKVEYISTVVTPQDLKCSMQSIGYDLIIEESADGKDALAEVHRQRLQE